MTSDAQPLEAPLLSVVIPTHDVRPWARQALDSVLRQRGADMEVIVVDDGSSDGTLDLLSAYADRDARVTVVPSDGPGGGTARNTGAARARGRYLIFADGDDLIPDGAYDALVGSLEESGSDMAIGDYLKFRAVDTWRPTAVMPAFDRAARGTTVRDAPSLLFSRPCWNRAFRRTFWEDAGLAFPDARRSNDIVPMVTAMIEARSLDVVEDCVYVYRERPGAGSMTSNAAAAPSLVSYLTQERICADLVVATGDSGLTSAHAELVWERDGYVAVATFLSGWAGPGEGDGEVVSALADLLATVAAPADPASLRALALRLAARGELAAARAVVLVRDGAEFARASRDPEPSGDAVSRVTDIATGGMLVVEGTAAQGDRPCLFDAEATAAHGETHVLLPTSVAWGEETGDLRSWAAAFPVGSVPLHRPLTPALLTDRGDVRPLPGQPQLPPYSARDAFLVHLALDAVVIRRRRHWAPRAVRRAAILAVGAVRRLLRR